MNFGIFKEALLSFVIIYGLIIAGSMIAAYFDGGFRGDELKEIFVYLVKVLSIPFLISTAAALLLAFDDQLKARP